MTARKTDTWVIADREPNGMTSTGGLKHIDPSYGNTTEEIAAVIGHVNRHATDARDADRLKRALGLVGAR